MKVLYWVQGHQFDKAINFETSFIKGKRYTVCVKPKSQFLSQLSLNSSFLSIYFYIRLSAFLDQITPTIS